MRALSSHDPGPSAGVAPALPSPPSAALLLALGVVFLGVFAGCGGGSTPEGPSGAASTGAATNVSVAIDHTSARSGPEIASRYEQAARRAVEAVLANGGHLRVSVFAGAGVDPTVLFDEDVPDVEHLRGNDRKRFLVAARKTLKDLLSQALGLAEPPKDSPLAAQLAAMRPDGSDVAGAIYQETELLADRGGGEVITLSDALQRSSDVDLSSTIATMTEDAAAAALAPLMPERAAGIEISIRGVGVTGNDVNVTTERSRKLVSVWDRACEGTGATACDVTVAV